MACWIALMSLILGWCLYRRWQIRQYRRNKAMFMSEIDVVELLKVHEELGRHIECLPERHRRVGIYVGLPTDDLVQLASIHPKDVGKVGLHPAARLQLLRDEGAGMVNENGL